MHVAVLVDSPSGLVYRECLRVPWGLCCTCLCWCLVVCQLHILVGHYSVESNVVHHISHL